MYCFITCGGNNGVADQTDTGVMASDHCDVVVLPARQVREIAVRVGVVTVGVVAKTSASIDGVQRGAESCVPRNHGDVVVTVHSCREVGGDAWGWKDTAPG